MATGLQRVNSKSVSAVRAFAVRFEQFFTAEPGSITLARKPDLLKGRAAEVTLLFCDVRGFSRVSEKLAPAETMEWIGEVLNALSACVLQEGGVLVDYVGDEILAMWERSLSSSLITPDAPVRRLPWAMRLVLPAAPIAAGVRCWGETTLVEHRHQHRHRSRGQHGLAKALNSSMGRSATP